MISENFWIHFFSSKMPRLKAGETPKSSRHIRRLAKQKTEEELRQVRNKVLNITRSQNLPVSQNLSNENVATEIDKEAIAVYTASFLEANSTLLESTSSEILDVSMKESELLDETTSIIKHN